MMPYSNEYDAIPICRTHGACVNTPNVDASVRYTLTLSVFETSPVTRPKQPLGSEGPGAKKKMAMTPQLKRFNSRCDAYLRV